MCALLFVIDALPLQTIHSRPQLTHSTNILFAIFSSVTMPCFGFGKWLTLQFIDCSVIWVCVCVCAYLCIVQSQKILVNPLKYARTNGAFLDCIKSMRILMKIVVESQFFQKLIQEILKRYTHRSIRAIAYHKFNSVFFSIHSLITCKRRWITAITFIHCKQLGRSQTPMEVKLNGFEQPSVIFKLFVSLP